MAERPLTAQAILALAEALQDVTLTPEQAERLAALQTRFNDALRGQRGRAAFEAEPADFARLLHEYRDEAP